jgi:rod shape-determining protein MreC
MNKKFTLFLIIITFAILYIFNVERLVKIKLAALNDHMQSMYIDTIVTVSEASNKYFNQLSYIEQLKEDNNKYRIYKALYDTKVNEFNELNTSLQLKTKDNKNYEKIKVLSYYKFNDFSRVIIDKKDIQKNKIYALITYDGFSAGIVLHKNNKSVAYLNQNKRCNYTVFIGDEKTPGITSGMLANGSLVIKHVPIWKDVKIGDEVITSSMDSIFPYGVRVGKVQDINIKENTKEVFVKPYAQILGNRDFYLYKNDTNSTSSEP